MAAHRLLIALALAALSCSWLGAPARVRAEPYGQFHRPQDHWRVLDTRYFRIYFTQDTPQSAAYLRDIADDTFERLNAFYDYRPPGKISVVIVGYTSFSNGFADSDRDRITIFTSVPDFHSRSRVPWFDNVFTHELSHILSLNTATHWYKRVPLVLGTGLGRFQQSQTLVKLPIFGRNFPHWFSEGVAQFDTSLLGRDSFDENRAALQRALFEDRLLFPLGKLAFFGGEQWYNSGFSFLQYLEARFGAGTVHALFREAGKGYDYLFDGLFDRALRVPIDTLEAGFRAEVENNFAAHRAATHDGRFDGQPVIYEDTEPPYAALTPQERERVRDAYVGMPLRYDRGKLFYRQAGVISYGDFDAATRTIKNGKGISAGNELAPHTATSWFVLKFERDESTVLPTYFRPDYESANLLLIDADGTERRLIPESRLSDIDACAARSELAAVYDDGDGSLKLALYTLTDYGTPNVEVRRESLRFPLPPQAFDEVRDPRYGPDCKKLYFSRRVGRDHDVFAYDFETRTLEPVSAEPGFELYPDPTRDGVYYVSSRDGTMNVYFKRYGETEARQVTGAITGHHHPIDTPDALVFGRLYGTGFQIHAQPHDHRPPTPSSLPLHKPVQLPAAPNLSALEPADDYNPIAPRDLVSPTIVPLLDLEFDAARSYDGALRAQAGIELFVQDELYRHVLLLRGYAGDQNSFLFDYDNTMTPLGLRVRAGFNDARGLWVYESGDARYEQITNSRWGFLWGSVRFPLNLFYTLSAFAETIRDVGTTTGARSRQYDLLSPAYARELFGVSLNYDGLDRRDPTFRERDINKRGYRQFTLNVSYGLERVNPNIARQDASLRAGSTPFVRAEVDYSEYIALPALARGYFDHSLQLDLTLGYISADLDFFPFYGGGRLYSQAAPEYNASVGFAGYSYGSLRGETLANLGVAYRGPIVRNLGFRFGPIYLHDVYFQLFTSWGNIWSFDRDGRRQRPFLDDASNGRHFLGDVGIDMRLGHFLQEIETNVGTTLRMVYRLVPFSECASGDVSQDRSCLGIDGERGLMFYFIVGGGF